MADDDTTPAPPAPAAHLGEQLGLGSQWMPVDVATELHRVGEGDATFYVLIAEGAQGKQGYPFTKARLLALGQAFVQEATGGLQIATDMPPRPAKLDGTPGGVLRA